LGKREEVHILKVGFLCTGGVQLKDSLKRHTEGFKLFKRYWSEAAKKQARFISFLPLINSFIIHQ
jgi:hypothetical protein